MATINEQPDKSLSEFDDRSLVEVGIFDGNEVSASQQDGKRNLTTFDAARWMEREVYNSTGSTITKLTPVHYSQWNAVEGGGVTEAVVASNTSGLRAHGVMWPNDLADGSRGRVIEYGDVSGFDTSSASPGDYVYLSNGTLTLTAPLTDPQVVGIVLYSAVDGVIRIDVLEDAPDPLTLGYEIVDAPGDGSDQTTQINNAITAANGARAVWLPPGTYLTDNLFLTIPGTTLKAQQGTATLLAADGAMIYAQADGISLEGLILDGNGNARIGVWANLPAPNLTIKETEIRNLGYSGQTNESVGVLLKGGCDNFLLIDSHIHNINGRGGAGDEAARGVRFAEASVAAPTGCRIINTVIEKLYPQVDADGVVTQDFNTEIDLVIDGCTIRDSMKRAVKAQIGGVHIKNSTLSCSNYLGNLDPGDPLYDNTALNPRAIFSIFGPNCSMSNCTITAPNGLTNAVWDNANGTYNNINIIGNTVDIPAGHGEPSLDVLDNDGTCTDLTFHCNSINCGDARDGVRMNVGMKQCSFGGNTWNGITRHIYHAEGGAALVDGITITGDTWKNCAGASFINANSEVYIKEIGNLGDTSITIKKYNGGWLPHHGTDVDVTELGVRSEPGSAATNQVILQAIADAGVGMIFPDSEHAYEITDRITYSGASNINIRGAGMLSTVIQQTTANGTAGVFYFENCSGFEISGLHLRGHNWIGGLVDQASSRSAVRTYRSNNGHVHNCAISGFSAYGIQFYSVDTCSAEENLFFYNVALVGGLPRAGEDINCSHDSNASDVENPYFNRQVRLVNNFCLSNNNGGIDVNDTMEGLVVHGNMCVACDENLKQVTDPALIGRKQGITLQYAVYDTDPYHNEIEGGFSCVGNYIANCRWSGIYCNSFPNQPDNPGGLRGAIHANVISNFAISASGEAEESYKRAAISIEQAQQLSVIGNVALSGGNAAVTTTGKYAYGITASTRTEVTNGNPSFIDLSNNILVDIIGGGIAITDIPSGVRIDNNLIHNCRNDYIDALSTNASSWLSVCGNILTQSTDHTTESFYVFDVSSSNRFARVDNNMIIMKGTLPTSSNLARVNANVANFSFSRNYLEGPDSDNDIRGIRLEMASTITSRPWGFAIDDNWIHNVRYGAVDVGTGSSGPILLSRTMWGTIFGDNINNSISNIFEGNRLGEGKVEIFYDPTSTFPTEGDWIVGDRLRWLEDNVEYYCWQAGNGLAAKWRTAASAVNASADMGLSATSDTMTLDGITNNPIDVMGTSLSPLNITTIPAAATFQFQEPGRYLLTFNLTCSHSVSTGQIQLYFLSRRSGGSFLIDQTITLPIAETMAASESFFYEFETGDFSGAVETRVEIGGTAGDVTFNNASMTVHRIY